MTIALLISIFVTVSLWEYCMFFHRQGLLPYAQGYNAFSLIHWLACIVGLIHAFGWLWGVLAFLFVVTLLQYVTHFTLGVLWGVLFKKETAIPLAAFAVMVWTTVLLSGAHLIWGPRHI
jgi:hypothetical protein